jgi:hypothetical protein
VPGVRGWWLVPAALPVLAVGVWGLARLVRSFPPVAWMVAAYVAMLLVWPFIDGRLVSPLHPWMVAAVAAGLIDVVGRVPERARRVVGAAAVVWVGAYATVTASRAAGDWDTAGYHIRAGRLANAVEALDRTTPSSAVVGAPEFWPAVILHSGRSAVPSARFTPRSEEKATPVWGTPKQQLRIWWQYRVDHVLLEQNGLIHGDALNLLEETCPGSAMIVARMPAQMLVELRWNEVCAAKLGLLSGPQCSATTRCCPFARCRPARRRLRPGAPPPPAGRGTPWPARPGGRGRSG